MRNRAVARRYAQGLFQVGSEHGLLDELGRELQSVVDALSQSPELKTMLEHPRVSATRKIEVIEERFAGSVSSYTTNLLRLLVRKHREAYLDLMLEEYQTIYDGARGVGRARVLSAGELPDEVVERMRVALSEAFRLDMRVDVEVDPELIGGLVVQVGDRRIDASLRGRLRRLRDHIAAGRSQMGVS